MGSKVWGPDDLDRFDRALAAAMADLELQGRMPPHCDRRALQHRMAAAVLAAADAGECSPERLRACALGAALEAGDPPYPARGSLPACTAAE
jgi:hypothetical protein